MLSDDPLLFDFDYGDDDEEEEYIGFFLGYDDSTDNQNLTCFTTFNVTLRPPPHPTPTPTPTTFAPSMTSPYPTENPTPLSTNVNTHQTPAPTASESLINMEIIGTILEVFVIGVGLGYFVWYSLPGRTRTIGSNHPARNESAVQLAAYRFYSAPSQSSTGVLPPRNQSPAEDPGLS